MNPDLEELKEQLIAVIVDNAGSLHVQILGNGKAPAIGNAAGL